MKESKKRIRKTRRQKKAWKKRSHAIKNPPAGHTEFLDQGKHLDLFLRQYNNAKSIKSRWRMVMEVLGIETFAEFKEEFCKDPEEFVIRLKEAFNSDPRSDSYKLQAINELKRLATWLWSRNQMRDSNGNLRPMPVIESPSTAMADTPMVGETLTIEEIARIEARIEMTPTPTKERDRFLFACLYYQGLRVSEALSIRFCDYEEDPRERGGIGWLLIEQKARFGRVKVSVCQETHDAFMRYRSLWESMTVDQETAGVFQSTSKLEYVYHQVNMTGERVGPSSFTKSVLKAMDANTLRLIVRQWGEWIGYTKIYHRYNAAETRKGLCPHDLRHNAITHLVDQGVNTEDIAAFARHASGYLVQRYDLKTSVRQMKCASSLAQKHKVGLYTRKEG